MSTVEQILMRKGPDVIVAPPSATVFEACELMSAANVGALVVRKDNEVFGIFTERDLLKRVIVAGKDPREVHVAEVMTGSVESCRLCDGIARIQEMMSAKSIRHLPVIEDGVLVGMIGLRDVLAERLREIQGEE